MNNFSGNNSEHENRPPEVDMEFRKEYFTSAKQDSQEGQPNTYEAEFVNKDEDSFGAGKGSSEEAKTSEEARNYSYNKPKKKKEKTAMSGLAKFMLVSSCLVLSVLSSAAMSFFLLTNTREQNKTQTLYQESNKSQQNNEGASKIDTRPASSALSSAEIAKKASPAVVAINSLKKREDIFGLVRQGINAGSGVIISSDGHIVTNSHVVHGSSKLSVTLADGKKYDAKLLAENEMQDLALIKIEGKNFPFLKFGDSNKLAVGEPVVAIGNPLGELQGTVTTGVVSALNRDVEVQNNKMMNLIQTDAAINHGNSGGALVNQYGELIGINVARSEDQRSPVQGIAFAIPSETVKLVLEQLTNPNYKRPYLGIRGTGISAELRQKFKLPEGVWVVQVEPNSPAAKAGLEERDIILEFDGKKVKGVQDLQLIRNKHKAGDRLKIKVEREKKQVELEIVLGEMPKETQSQPDITEQEP